MSRIEHLYVSAGHNYFGHHGEPAGGHPPVAMTAVECVAGRGLRGDRFFDYQPDYKGQVTFFAMEILETLAAELNVPAATPAVVRRNVFTRGLDLNRLIGTEFEFQDVRFAGVEECRPCHWMDEALGPGAEAWLRGRILTDGWLRRDGA
jgi:MOSC domain-containing protein YiiM